MILVIVDVEEIKGGLLLIFVYFQGSNDNCNQYVVKELAITSTDGSFLQNWFVRSPFSQRNLGIKLENSVIGTSKIVTVVGMTLQFKISFVSYLRF